MWGTIASVAGNVLGALANNAFSAASQRQQYEYQRDFFQHQHQWEMNDLRAAGLNPILAATHGSSPGGGNVSPVITPDIARGIPEAIMQSRKIDEIEKAQLALNSESTTSAVALNKAREVVADAEARNLVASANLSNSAAALNAERAITERASQGHLFSQTELARADTALRPVQAADIKAQAALRRAELPQRLAEGAYYSTEQGKAAPYTQGTNWRTWVSPKYQYDSLVDMLGQIGSASASGYRKATDFIGELGSAVKRFLRRTIHN